MAAMTSRRLTCGMDSLLWQWVLPIALLKYDESEPIAFFSAIWLRTSPRPGRRPARHECQVPKSGTLALENRVAPGTLALDNRVALGTLALENRVASGTLALDTRVALGSAQERSDILICHAL